MVFTALMHFLPFTPSKVARMAFTAADASTYRTSIAEPASWPLGLSTRLRNTSSHEACAFASWHVTARAQNAGSRSATNALTSEYASSTHACCAEHTLST